MAEVIILFNVKTKPVKEKIEKELLWHDLLRGELLRFYGGKLDFEYKEDEYIIKMPPEERKRKGITTTFRMLPKVTDLEVVNYNKTKTDSNESDVRKWFKDYLNYNITDASITSFDRNGLTIEVSEEGVDDLLYQAERNGFKTRR